MNPAKLYVIRPISKQDINALIALSKTAKSGLSNLPKTDIAAKKLISTSIKSFNNTIKPHLKKFFFVIKNENNKTIGISGIKARTGTDRPYYSFIYHQTVPYPYLELSQFRLGPSEIGSLFLAPTYRDKKIGRLLSLSRFLFIRNFRSYFTETIIAEMRGYLSKNNQSPIWNALGKKFIPLTFHQADISSISDPSFIEKKFPKQPIYLNLLDPNCHQYFQQVHPLTEPAKRLLLSESFNITNHIDIFDGGPKLECLTKKIRTIHDSKVIQFKELPRYMHQHLLVSNTKFKNFRACKANPDIHINAVKSALNVSHSDQIVIIKERP